jgi:hypothetical protein
MPATVLLSMFGVAAIGLPALRDVPTSNGVTTCLAMQVGIHLVRPPCEAQPTTIIRASDLDARLQADAVLPGIERAPPVPGIRRHPARLSEIHVDFTDDPVGVGVAAVAVCLVLIAALITVGVLARAILTAAFGDRLMRVRAERRKVDSGRGGAGGGPGSAREESKVK